MAAQYTRRTMDLWIQPCRRCADLYGKLATEPPHADLTLDSASAVTDAEEHYTCERCRAVFARILRGPAKLRIWLLLNASQHYHYVSCRCREDDTRVLQAI